MLPIKYHVNDKGEARECHAQVCPLGEGTIHSETKAEAESLYETSKIAQKLPGIRTLSENKLKRMSKDELINEIITLSDDPKIKELIYLSDYCHIGTYRHTLRPDVVDKDEYIMHPMRNAIRSYRLVGQFIDKNEKDTLIAASLLHDTVEDAPEKISEYYEMKTNLSPNQIIEMKFGKKVSDTVYGMTNPEYPKGISKAEKHKFYQEHVKEAIVDPNVLVTKSMDLIDNAGSLSYIRNDPKKASSLAKKYLPAIEHVIEAIPTTLTNKDAQKSLLKRMKQLKTKAEELVID